MTYLPDDLDDSSGDRSPIVHFLYEPGNGGLDRVAVLLANEMAARAIPTELWLSQTDGPMAPFIADNVTVRLVPTVSYGKRGLKLFLQVPALARMIRQYRPKAILSAGNQSNLTIAVAKQLARSTNTKVIQKITNPIIRPNMSKTRALERKFRFQQTVRLGDLCLVLSKADARNYGAMMPAVADRFHAICNPYVSDEMLELGHRRPGNEPSSGRSLLSVGRLEYQKDHATALRALARLKHLDWQFKILGNGPLERDLRALAAQLGIADRVAFEGFHPNPTAVYAKSDILILSSRWEGLPAVPLEAMACGCDIVTTDCSEGVTDLLKSLERPTVKVGDDCALAQVIKSAMNDRVSPNFMIKIAERYSIPSSIEDHLQKITKFVGRR